MLSLAKRTRVGAVTSTITGCTFVFLSSGTRALGDATSFLELKANSVFALSVLGACLSGR